MPLNQTDKQDVRQVKEYYDTLVSSIPNKGSLSMQLHDVQKEEIIKKLGHSWTSAKPVGSSFHLENEFCHLSWFGDVGGLIRNAIHLISSRSSVCRQNFVGVLVQKVLLTGQLCSGRSWGIPFGPNLWLAKRSWISGLCSWPRRDRGCLNSVLHHLYRSIYRSI